MGVSASIIAYSCRLCNHSDAENSRWQMQNEYRGKSGDGIAL